MISIIKSIINETCDICFEKCDLELKLCNCKNKYICKKCFMNILKFNNNYFICPFCNNKTYIKSEITYKLNKPKNITLI